MLIKNFKSLALSKERKIALEIIEEGLKALDYEKTLHGLNGFITDIARINTDTPRMDTDLKRINTDNPRISVLDPCSSVGDVYLVGFGKGSAKIADILRKKIKFKEIYVIDVKGRYFLGTHPLPSRKNFLFTQKLVKRFQGKLIKNDLVIVLVCGGGSAMLVYPKIDLKKYIQVNQELLKSGANIYEMNTVRKHLDLVKGGGLLKIFYPATVVSLIFSDVPGNDLSFIASGPTVKDKTKIADALRIIKKYKLKSIKKEDLIETPKEEKYFQRVKNILVLSNLTALRAMKEKAESFGFKAKILTDNLKGDVENVAKFLFSKIKKNKENILICGGETTVKVKGKGKGGRNQELVLWFLKYLTTNKHGYNVGVNPFLYQRSSVVIVSLNSDGWDNTEFAGAIGDKMTIEKAKKLNLDIDKFLENNDSFNFFKRVKDGIVTGRLPVNVADLILVWKI